MTKQSLPFVSIYHEWLALYMHRTMRSFVRYARGRSLSMSQFSALFQINRHGQLVVSDIGDDLGVTNAAASQLLERLVQQELVVRTENPQDRREKKLILTDQGRHLLVEAAAACQTWLDPLVESMTPEERARVEEGLGILIDHMKQMPDEV